MKKKTKLQNLHDAKIAKEAVEKFVSELRYEIDSLDMKHKFCSVRIFNGIHGEEFNDLSKYSPILYLKNISIDKINKSLNDLYVKHKNTYNKILDTL